MAKGVKAALTTADRIDSLCDEYERKTRAGDPTRLDEFVSTSIDADHETLLPELVALDIELRVERGEQPTAADYDMVMGSRNLCFDVGSEVAAVQQRLRGDESESNRTLPRLVGRYRLEALVGRGAFGEVYKAFDTLLRRPVAVKTLRPDRQLARPLIQHLLDEARSQAQLAHPAIVPVLDYGDEPECHIVSAWVEGETLAERAKSQTRLNVREAVQIVIQVAGALESAHEQGLVHRDVKPSNILIDRQGRARLTDFGLAVTSERRSDEPPATVGTYAYMSPEQARGESRTVDGRSDVYSLGVILYQLLTGEVPFQADSRDAWRQQIESAAPRPPRSIRSVPRALEEICLKCLAKQGSDRFQSAGELAAALQKAIQPRRWPMAVAAGCAAALVLLVIWSLPGPDVLIAAVTDLSKQNPQLSIPEPDRRNSISEIDLERRPRVESAWSISSDARTITASSPDEAMMLGIGDCDSGSMVFEVELHPTDWEGGAIGVFLGLPDTIDPDRITYKSIYVSNVFDKPHCTLSIDSRSDQTRGVGSRPIPAPPNGFRLRIEIEDGRLARLQLNDVDYPWHITTFNEYVDIWEGHDGNCRGKYGLYARCGSTEFTNVSIDGVEVKFQDR